MEIASYLRREKLFLIYFLKTSFATTFMKEMTKKSKSTLFPSVAAKLKMDRRELRRRKIILNIFCNALPTTLDTLFSK